MRVIKLFGISAIVLFVVVTLISLLLPSRVRISRAIDIGQPKERIMPYVSDLRKWQRWNDLINASLANSPGNLIASDSIQSNKLLIRLLRATEDSVFTTWHPESGDKFYSGFALMGGTGHTTVQWYFDFHLRWYPWEKFSSIIYDNQMGPSMETSLEHLKKVIETSQ